MSSETYICYHDCYYGPPGLRRLYSAGEKLIPGIPPGKYFSKNGEPPDGVDPSNKAIVPGDDPRSTDHIRKDLKEDYGVEMPENASRKDLFYRYIKESTKAEEPRPALQPIQTVSADVAKILTMKFTEMTPDDIDKLSSNDISAKIQKDFGRSEKPTSKNKDELLKKAIMMEIHGGN